MTPFQHYSQTLDLIVSGHLLKAIRLQKEQLMQLQSWTLLDEQVKIEETYTLMLKYFADGVEDTRRLDIYNDILDRTLDMAEKIKRQMGFHDSTGHYYSKLRTVARQRRTLVYYTRRLQAATPQLLMEQILEDDTDTPSTDDNARAVLLEELFDYIWVAGTMTEEEYDDLESLFAGSVISGAEKQWLVSALTLSLLSYYDQPKLNMLINIADSYDAPATSDDAVLFAHALVGIALAAMYYRQRFAVRPMPLFFEFKPEINKAFVMLQLQCLVQYQTHRIRQTLDQDFMSLINKLKGHISGMDELKNLLEGEDPELPPGVDPEIVRSIQDRIKQVSDMTHRGLDMMYQQFRQMKAFPFFRETRNWLKPASVSTPQFDSTLSTLAPLLNLSHLCDSDKHSLVSMLSSMPQSFSQMLMLQMQELDLQSASAQDLMREERERILSAYNTLFSDVPVSAVYSSVMAYAGTYLQDLYRYFTIRMEHEPDGNPFIASAEMLFLDAPLLKPRLEPHELDFVSRYALKMRLYRQSLHLNSTYLFADSDAPEMLQRKAFCFAMLKDSHSAVDTFQQCEKRGHSLSDDMQALYASCLMSEGRPLEAIKIYQQLFAREESALSLYSYAVALSQTEQYAEACNVLYQEDFLRPNQIRVVRLLTWCSMKRLAQSQEGIDMATELNSLLHLYQRLLAMEPLRGADWFNAGHAALACGNVAQAIDYYTHSDISSFSADDRSLLAALGVPTLTLRLVADALERE